MLGHKTTFYTYNSDRRYHRAIPKDYTIHIILESLHYISINNSKTVAMAYRAFKRFANSLN